MYVCMYVCMYIYIYIYIYAHTCASVCKQRQTRRFGIGGKGSYNQVVVLYVAKTRVLVCRGVLRTHCPSFVALRSYMVH